MSMDFSIQDLGRIRTFLTQRLTDLLRSLHPWSSARRHTILGYLLKGTRRTWLANRGGSNRVNFGVTVSELAENTCKATW